MILKFVQHAHTSLTESMSHSVHATQLVVTISFETQSCNMDRKLHHLALSYWNARQGGAKAKAYAGEFTPRFW